jgi:spore photoproduct lyase
MKHFSPQQIFIERRARDYPMTREVLSRFSSVPHIEIDNYQTMGAAIPGINARLRDEKSSLILAVKDGELVREVDRDLFRPTPGQFYIIHSLGCPFDCEYCFLYDYLDHQRPAIFVNLEDIFARLREIIGEHSSSPTVFHAGEFSDALAYDHITNLSEPLVRFFAKQKHARLELRTKSDNVANLLNLNHNGNTIVSWTFNPEEIVQRSEHLTASLDERIAAARQCQDAGYLIGLRFDPIVWTTHWQKNYREMLKRIFDVLDARKISDISLGMFRATPGLKSVIQSRFGGRRSILLAGELVQSGDGKYRYFKPIRIEMYRALIGWIRERAPQVKIELCMESPEVEERVASGQGASL